MVENGILGVTDSLTRIARRDANAVGHAFVPPPQGLVDCRDTVLETCSGRDPIRAAEDSRRFWPGVAQPRRIPDPRDRETDRPVGVAEPPLEPLGAALSLC